MFPKSIRAPAAAVVGVMLGLGLGEIGVRAAGRKPYFNPPGFSERPHLAMREADAALGWRNRPGQYADADGQGVRVRILADGSRITSENPPPGGPRVVLLGGSFVFGQAIGDEDTLGWLLQQGDRARRYANHGVSGYGTCQALLVLERLFEGDDPPAKVLYGTIEHHKIRNIGKKSWLKNLVRTADNPAITLPACDIDGEGALVRIPAARYREWPLQRAFALVNLTQDAVAAIADRPKMKRRQRIAEAALLQMAALCREHGSELLVLLLEPEAAHPNPDTEFLLRSGIAFLDLRFPHSAELVVPNDGHPNGLVTRRWAAMVASRIGEDAPPSGTR